MPVAVTSRLPFRRIFDLEMPYGNVLTGIWAFLHAAVPFSFFSFVYRLGSSLSSSIWLKYDLHAKESAVP